MEVRHTVVWDDNNWLGLYQEWVDELVADGYTLIDNRTEKEYSYAK